MRRFVSLLVLLLLLSSVALAHSGRTDSKGGHMNHSTGEYHYHHGYSAHQHENDICPYDNKDKSGQNSGSSSSSSSKSSSSASSTGTMTYYRTTANVNMRSSASGKSSVITTIPSNTKVKYMGSTSGNWIQVYYDRHTGWVYSDYLVLLPRTVVTVKPTVKPTVKLTVEPTSSPSQVSVLSKAEKFYKKHEDWLALPLTALLTVVGLVLIYGIICFF